MPSTPPPPDVIEAFGLSGEPAPLSGGQGDAWRVSDVVLKPGSDPTFQEWLGTELASIEQIGFTLPRVVRTTDGRFVAEGWGATNILPGISSESGDVKWTTVVDVGRAFHRATSTLARPPWLTDRTDWWARADRATWGEEPMDVIPPLRPLVTGLSALLEPLGPDQLVHADLTGNVLLAPDRPAGIIDISPYWRPPAYADGVVVADAISWHGASMTLARDADVSVAAVARGLLFRALTTNAIQLDVPDPSGLDRDLAQYATAFDALVAEGP